MNSPEMLEKAEKAALSLLRFRNTRRTLSDKLKRKGFKADVVEEVLNKLERLGYINDEQYAMDYAIDALRLKKHGKMKIKTALAAKGISREIIKKVISSADEELELENLTYFAEKTFGQSEEVTKGELEKFKRKMISRGYSFRQIDMVLADKKIVYDDWM